MPDTIDRRLFLKLSGAGTGVAVAASHKPAHAGPPKKKTLTDSGRAADRLSLGDATTSGYEPGYLPGY